MSSTSTSVRSTTPRRGFLGLMIAATMAISTLGVTEGARAQTGSVYVQVKNVYGQPVVGAKVVANPGFILRGGWPTRYTGSGGWAYFLALSANANWNFKATHPSWGQATTVVHPVAGQTTYVTLVLH